MNSEGRIGKQIKWLKPVEQRDYNNLVENVDFIMINGSQICPVCDGSPILFQSDPMKEWLLITIGEIPNPDYTYWSINEVSKPTNTKDQILVNYNQWQINYELVERSESEIIDLIKEEERQANLLVMSECDKIKTDAALPAVYFALMTNQTLTACEQAVKERATEFANIAAINATNATNLINLVKQGLRPDIKSGWQYDSITKQCHYYNETED